MTPDTCTLESIGGGAAGELFSRELEEVLDNIADVNTNAEDERSITITVTFKPSDDRTMPGAVV